MRMGLLVEMCEALRAILFIDEIHGIVGAGASASAGPDAANILKPALARGGFSVIGATTPNEARRLRSDRALMRRFSEIRLGEPDATETRQIIGRAIGGYESHHGVTYAREALDLAVALADSFLPERRFPDKAFEVLDSAGVVTSSDGREVVDEEDIRRAVARIGGAPVGRGDAREAARLATLGERLQARIFGQDEAVAALVRAARIAHAGVTPGGVAGAYLFNGPTGSGKTALASAFASELGLPLVRIDMSEFMERHSASGLIGAPPGYVGFDRPGRLIEAADTHGRMVLLLDEAEKAHRDVFDILLQLLDYGHVTGGDGRRVSFRGSHVILTANLGAGAEVKAPIGFGRECNAGAAAGEAIASAFRRELLGRIPNRIHFAAPDGDARSRIIRAEVNRVIAHLALGGTTLEVTDEAMAALCSVADPEDGRGLAMLVAREISDRLAVAMIDHPEATAFRIAPGPDSLQAHQA